MSSEPNLGLISYQKNQARYKQDAKDGLWPFIVPDVYYLPFPLTEEEYQRLLYCYFLGDEVATEGIAKEPEIDPQQDDINRTLRGKLLNFSMSVSGDECCIDGPPGDPGNGGGLGTGIFDPPIENQPPDGDEPPGYPPGGGGGDDECYSYVANVLYCVGCWQGGEIRYN